MPCQVEIMGIAGALQIYGCGTALFLAHDSDGLRGPIGSAMLSLADDKAIKTPGRPPSLFDHDRPDAGESHPHPTSAQGSLAELQEGITYHHSLSGLV